MKIVDTHGIRALVTRAHLTGKDALAFPLVDVVAMVDELEMARATVHGAGGLLVECVQLLSAITEPGLFVAAKHRGADLKRIRSDIGELLPLIQEALGEEVEPIVIEAIQAQSSVIQIPTPQEVKEIIQ